MEPQYDNRDFEGRVVEVQKNVKNYPWEEWYDDRTYTNSDGDEVRAYEDGADMTITVMEVQGDGVPDNPGSQLWQKPVRTGMTRNFSTSIGLSATLSLPLDGGLQERCKQAAETQIALQGQLLANKRLDFELRVLRIVENYYRKEFVFTPRVLMRKLCRCSGSKCNSHQTTFTYYSFPSAVEPTSTSSESSAVQQSSQTSIVPGSSYP